MCGNTLLGVINSMVIFNEEITVIEEEVFLSMVKLSLHFAFRNSFQLCFKSFFVQNEVVYTHTFLLVNIFVISVRNSLSGCNFVPFRHYFSLIFNYSVIIDHHEQKKISEYHPIMKR